MITFAAADGVPVTADVYAPHPATAPLLVLFHQAGYSRGEYRDLAPRLNQLGFNCLAVDLRSGHAVNGVDNATAAAATRLGKPTQYADAIADMRAAIAIARKDLARGKLVLWGSSYSSSLVLVLGGEPAVAADAVLAFSPGEYFEKSKPAGWVAAGARQLHVPTFITSARAEAASWKPIAQAIDPAKLTTFVPTTEGHHGSSALWPTQADSDACWAAVTAFLGKLAQ
jgi:predicted alpha/beta hydrolase